MGGSLLTSISLVTDAGDGLITVVGCSGLTFVSGSNDMGGIIVSHGMAEVRRWLGMKRKHVVAGCEHRS